jgi:23S rRNA pseudouridine1911/1915/1917 synthase
VESTVGERFVVPAALAGERVDRAVALLTGRSRSEIAGLVKEQKILLDGRAVGSGHTHVVAGGVIDVELGALPSGTPKVPVAHADVPFSVVYDDADVIVVDKPAGVVVHPGAGHADDTLVSGLLNLYPDLAELAVEGATSRPGIVHRLDKDTSGLLVVARSPAGVASLSAQLADRSMGRVYLALCKGLPDSDAGVIDAPLGRSLRDPKKMAVRAEGRFASTRYTVRQRYTEPEPFGFLECVLSTGRTHQIRVHLSAIGHPVAGDRQYGGTVRSIRLHRPFLHAARLGFTHPTTGAEMSFESPLPPELAQVLDLLTSLSDTPGQTEIV